MEYTEEEKKAIEDLKLTIEQEKEELPYSEESLKNNETLLNLIEKQQKEITILENTRNCCPLGNTSGIICNVKKGDYIPKEVIRDLKKKLEDKSKRESVFLFEVINMIKELLGE